MTKSSLPRPYLTLHIIYVVILYISNFRSSRLYMASWRGFRLAEALTFVSYGALIFKRLGAGFLTVIYKNLFIFLSRLLFFPLGIRFS